jgi:hypothetical protein
MRGPLSPLLCVVRAPSVGPQVVVFAIGPGTTRAHGSALVQAFEALCSEADAQGLQPLESAAAALAAPHGSGGGSGGGGSSSTHRVAVGEGDGSSTSGSSDTGAAAPGAGQRGMSPREAWFARSARCGRRRLGG